MYRIKNMILTGLLLCLSSITYKAVASNSMCLPAEKEKGEVTRAYVTYSDDIDWQKVEAVGAKVNTCLDGIATVTVPADSIPSLKKVSGVIYVQKGHAVTQQMDQARKDAVVDAVHRGTNLVEGYTGKGVVIGIVDSGIDYTHPAFRSIDGKLRIQRVWEQGTTSSQYGKTPEQGYGTEFTTADAILAVAGDTEAGSHGTHVLGIAAGSLTATSDYYGVAPDADLVVVAISPTGDTGTDNVCVSDAINYIYSYAESVGKPCVVNLSLGSHLGPHDGTSLFDVYADRLQGPGRLLVGAAGNYGSYTFHVSKNFTSADDAPVKTFLDYQITPSKNNYGGVIDIWGEGDFEISLLSYNTFSHTQKDELVLYPLESADATVNFGSNVTGSFHVTSEVSPLNGKKHIMIETGVTSLRTNYSVALKITPRGEATVDAWTDHKYFDFSGKNEEGFYQPAEESTITEIGGTGKRIITVGAYITRDKYTLLSGQTLNLQEKAGALYSFSGYGPTADGRMKPDVCAPGGVIISSLSHNDQTGTQQVAFNRTYMGEVYPYGYQNGTSMSSPFVAGTLALWLQAYPELTPEQVRSILSTTAMADGTDATHWGYGKINAYAGVQAVESLVTGINDLTDDASFTTDVYDVTGRRIHPGQLLKSGIYIKGGKKWLK